MKTKILLLAGVLFFAGCNKPPFLGNIIGPEALHDRSVGASARELLSGSKFTSLKVEIQYMPGYAPDAGALAHLQQFLSATLNKPGGITIVTREIEAAAQTTFAISDIIGTEKKSRTVYSNNTEIALYILYTNGHYIEEGVLGVAYRNTSAALFTKKITDNSGGLGQPSRTKLEATVLEHEVGHLLGLVDTGTPMQAHHKDDAHGSHCTNSNCLMYYAAETTDMLGFLVTGNIPALDASCMADLKGNGGR